MRHLSVAFAMLLISCSRPALELDRNTGIEFHINRIDLPNSIYIFINDFENYSLNEISEFSYCMATRNKVEKIVIESELYNFNGHIKSIPSKNFHRVSFESPNYERSKNSEQSSILYSITTWDQVELKKIHPTQYYFDCRNERKPYSF